MAHQKYDADIPAGHSFAETRDLKPLDRRLRAAGFRIHARPRHGEPVWIRNGKLYQQGTAVEIMEREGRAAA